MFNVLVVDIKIMPVHKLFVPSYTLWYMFGMFYCFVMSPNFGCLIL